MKISIITACYNSIETIEQSLQSVLSQQNINLEYIVVDGASTDGTLEVINKYQQQLAHIISEPDNGIYDALNKGINLATGDIVGILHADDFYASNKILSYVINSFEQQQTDFIYGDLEYISASSNKVIRYWKSGEFSPKKLHKGWMPPHPTVFLKRKLYLKYGTFNTSYQISSDYELMLRLLSKPIKVTYLPRVLVKMRLGGVSNNSLKNIITKMQEDYQALHHNQVGGISSLLWKNLSKIPQFFK